MTELMERPSQKDRGRFVSFSESHTLNLPDGLVQLFHRMGTRAKESAGEYLASLQ